MSRAVRGRSGPVRALTLAVASLLVGCSDLPPIIQTVEEMIEFQSLDFSGALWEPLMPSATQGESVRVGGTLTVPPTDAPIPAVVITHGCAGVSSAERGWVRDLTSAGWATFLIDGFTGRGVAEICTGAESVNLAGMLSDVYRAGEAIADHPYVDSSRIAVLGLSFGGRTALWSGLRRFQDRYGGEPFAAYLAFYPASCYLQLERESEVEGGPIRIFHGTADDWLPIDQCREYVERLQAAGVDAALIEYDGARHSFDDVTLLPRQELPRASSPGGCTFVERGGRIIDLDTGQVATIGAGCVRPGVTIGFDRASREKAVVDVIGFLQEAFSR